MREFAYTAMVGASGSDALDLLLVVAQGSLAHIRTVLVDNSLNTAAFSMRMNFSNQNLLIPPGAQAVVPILQPNPPQLQFSSAGGVDVPLFFYEEPMPAIVWKPSVASLNLLLLLQGGNLQLVSGGSLLLV